MTSRLDTHWGVAYHNADAEVAQVVEHGTENAGVASSTLALGTSEAICVLNSDVAHTSGSGSVVEHLLAKERVAGSNPVFRSIPPTKAAAKGSWG